MKKGILLFGYVITMAFVWIWGFLVLIMAASLTTIESDLVGPVFVLLLSLVLEGGLIKLSLWLKQSIRAIESGVPIAKPRAPHEPIETVTEKDFGIRVVTRVNPAYADRVEKPAKSKPVEKAPTFTGDIDFIYSLVPDTEYAMEYEASNGEITDRDILFKRLDYKNDREYLYAVCFMRSRVRTFRADRVISLVDKATGEVLI